MLNPSTALLAEMSLSHTARIVLEVIGAIGVVLIVIVLLGALPMIPDLRRYLRIRRM